MNGQPRSQHLPAPLTALIGREHELAAATSTLLDRHVRLVTLTGPPGTGKTRLALAVAEEVHAVFEDGVRFVALGSLQRADLVLPTAAQALGVRQIGRRPLLEALIDALRDRRVLLVLDNFEHVLPAARVLADLLSACAGLKILVTSRARLRISGEHQLLVPPLDLPNLESLPEPAELLEVPAVRLFVERTRAVRPHFRLSTENSAPVAELCVRLDGLPLAIELAAARSGFLQPSELLERLENRLTLLTDGPPDLPPRQRALRSAIGWSYDLLSEPEQRVFRALGVFAGGCTLDAARAVKATEPLADTDVLACVEALVDRSLLRRVYPSASGEPPRVDMLETIRDYALERLSDSGELHTMQQRHAEYFVSLCESVANPQLDGPDGPQLMAALERDHDNLRAALRWLIDAGDADASMRLAGALWSFWDKRGYWSEAIRWLRSALALADGVASTPRARALMGLAIMHRERSEYALAADCGRECIALQRERADGSILPGSRLMVGEILVLAGDAESGAALVAEVTALRKGDPLAQAWCELVEGYIASYQGHFPSARTHYERALACRAGHSGNEVDANLLHAHGVIHAGAGDAAAARPLFEAALVQFRARGELRGVARVLLSLGALLAHSGDAALARATLEESLTVFRRLGEAVGVALCSMMLGLRLPEGMLAELGERALSMWWRVSMGRDAPPAADLAAWRVIPEQTDVAPKRRVPGQYGLTRRELEVLALIARRYSNKQIADELVLSIRTVERHITNIYAKTGLSSRRLAETYADYVFT